MARCPKCNTNIPPYGFPFNGKWTSIICHNCKTKLYIRIKDFYNWYLLPFLALSLLGLVILKYYLINPLILGISITLLSTFFFFKVGWQHTRLQVI